MFQYHHTTLNTQNQYHILEFLTFFCRKLSYSKPLFPLNEINPPFCIDSRNDVC